MTDSDQVPLTREELAALLPRLGYSEADYHLYGAHLSEALVMDRRPQGWVVFYSERGVESSLRVHEHEADACTDLLSRLRKYIGDSSS